MSIFNTKTAAKKAHNKTVAEIATSFEQVLRVMLDHPELYPQERVKAVRNALILVNAHRRLDV